MKPQAWILAAAAAALLLPRLGATDLWAPDEPRYGQVAEELRGFEHGVPGLLLLHLNGAPYTQKPPLYFWLAALAGSPGGRVDEGAARLPSALAGIATVAGIAVWGAALLGRRSGWLGAALLLTSFEFAWLARRAQLDVLLTLFEVAAIAAWWSLRDAREPPRSRLALLHGALGLAVLTKGPVGWLVPVLVMTAHHASARRLGALRALFPRWALALSIGPGLAWIAVATALAPSGFFAEAVGENLFGRFFAGTSHDRPFWYYLAQLPADALPWSLLWPVILWAWRDGAFRDPADPRAPARRMLAIWVAVTFVFFTLSTGKRGLYLLPCFPALALLCADALWRYRDRRGQWPAWATPVAAAVLLAAAVAGPAALLAGDRYRIDVPLWLALAPALWCGLAVFVLRRLRHAGPSAVAGSAVATVLGLELLLFAGFLPLLDPEKSPRPIAEAAASRTPPGQPIGLAGKRTLAGGLAYYAERPVVLLESVMEVDRFFAGGGRALVLPEKDLARFTRPGGVRVAQRARHGRRRLALVTPGRVAEGARENVQDNGIERPASDP